MASDAERRPERRRQSELAAGAAALHVAQAWRELQAISADLAFDLVLKNWDYSRSLRGAAEQALADAHRMQQRLSQEMLQAWQGSPSEIDDILDKDSR